MPTAELNTTMKQLASNVWKVVLHDDSSISEQEVVQIIQKHLFYSIEQCKYIASSARKTGRSVVVSAVRLIAEEYDRRLSDEGLTTTLEQ